MVEFLVEVGCNLLRAIIVVLLGVCAIVGGSERAAHFTGSRPPRWKHMLIALLSGFVALTIAELLNGG